GDADGGGANAGSRGLERLQDADAATAALAAEEAVIGDEAVVEDDFAGVRGAHAHLALLAAHRQPGVALVDHERLDAGPAGGGVGGGEDDVDVGYTSVRDE